MSQELANAPKIGMGCWAIGGPFTGYGAQIGWGEVDDAESIAALRAAINVVASCGLRLP